MLDKDLEAWGLHPEEKWRNRLLVNGTQAKEKEEECNVIIVYP